jgi:hypothetical protein
MPLWEPRVDTEYVSIAEADRDVHTFRVVSVKAATLTNQRRRFQDTLSGLEIGPGKRNSEYHENEEDNGDRYNCIRWHVKHSL